MTCYTEEYKGYTINIEQDDSAESPRVWDNLGTITAWSRRYNLSDSRHSYDVADFRRDVINNPNVISLPVYMYEHGGVALSTGPFSCQWDSGQVGWIHVDKDRARKEYNVKRITKATLNKVLACLESEIETYSKYLNGEVYGYDVKDPNGDSIDSCWGFIGDYDDSYMLQQARDSIDYAEREAFPLLSHANLI